MCFLAGIHSTRDLLDSPLASAVFETFVCAELRKQNRLGQRPGRLFFFRDRTKEVDFVLDRGGRFELLEAKWTEHPDARDASQLAHVAALLGEKNVLARSIVCRAANRYPVSPGIEAMSVADLAGI